MLESDHTIGGRTDARSVLLNARAGPGDVMKNDDPNLAFSELTGQTAKKINWAIAEQRSGRQGRRHQLPEARRPLFQFV